MSDLSSAFLAALGGGGFVAAGTLVVRAFLLALRATAAVTEQKDQTINRQDQTIVRQDTDIERLQLALLAARGEVGARDLTISDLRGQLARAREDTR
jgi:hypothetical protein